jgi:hypothetical protein
VTFTAQLGTDLSMPGNIALGYQLVTTTNVGDSDQWVVTLTDAVVDAATVTDGARGSTTITDSGDPG